MANPAQIDRIRASSAAIIQTPLSELVENREKWGPYNFVGARDFLERIYFVAENLNSLPIELVVDSQAEQIATQLDQAKAGVVEVAQFDPMRGNPNERVQQLTSSLRSFSDSLVSVCAPWIPFLAYQRGDVANNIAQMRSTALEMQELLRVEREHALKRREELEEILRATREASAEAGVGVFTADFARQAGDHNVQADKWLRMTAGFALVTLIVAILAALIPLPETASRAYIIQFMTSKLVVLLVLASATIWCGRLYKASMHQAASNLHRAHSLKTFQAFIQATGDEATRNAVLLETTRSIFAITPSGYLDSVEPAVDAGTKVLEIFRDTKKG